MTRAMPWSLERLSISSRRGKKSSAKNSDCKASIRPVRILRQARTSLLPSIQDPSKIHHRRPRVSDLKTQRILLSHLLLTQEPSKKRAKAQPILPSVKLPRVKPDKVVIMNAGDHHHSHQGQQKPQNEGHYDLHPLHPLNNDHHDHHQQQLRNVAAPTAAAYLASAASFDPVANEFADNKVKKPVGVIPVRVQHDHDHSHHHGYGSETGKKLEDEEECEIKDAEGELTTA
ncbi:MAG: hypothetical protein J3Q66DRAFT_4357 [Benniella sp.]|nr:MAG: hypothetical protein J3Q66DRAFT_4357 [Benniella sp.]